MIAERKSESIAQPRGDFCGIGPTIPYKDCPPHPNPRRACQLPEFERLADPGKAKRALGVFLTCGARYSACSSSTPDRRGWRVGLLKPTRSPSTVHGLFSGHAGARAVPAEVRHTGDHRLGDREQHSAGIPGAAHIHAARQYVLGMARYGGNPSVGN